MMYVPMFLKQFLPLSSDAEASTEPNSVTLKMEAERFSETSKQLILHGVRARSAII
jgi:hypothetical protein